jgi:dTDP-glucose pyrophosphorylase
MQHQERSAGGAGASVESASFADLDHSCLINDDNDITMGMMTVTASDDGEA